jgi:hypothetical protein
MDKITSARLVQISERNDKKYGDVEVYFEDRTEPFMVEFASAQDNDVVMTHVYQKSVSTELDWFDNNLHQAYEDVTMSLFTRETHQTNLGTREEFKQSVLEFGDVREELLRQLAAEGKSDPAEQRNRETTVESGDLDSGGDVFIV